VKGNVLYATVMGWPGEHAVIETLKRLWPDEIQSIRMLGTDQPLEWKLLDHGLVIKTPSRKPCDHAYVFRIERGQPTR
jgi:alpha-L-fucosidase